MLILSDSDDPGLCGTQALKACWNLRKGMTRRWNDENNWKSAGCSHPGWILSAIVLLYSTLSVSGASQMSTNESERRLLFWKWTLAALVSDWALSARPLQSSCMWVTEPWADLQPSACLPAEECQVMQALIYQKLHGLLPGQHAHINTPL